MNTTRRAPSRRVLNTPDLPPEIWMEILRQATLVPSILDPHDVLQVSLRAGWDKVQLYRQSLVTKRYLVRVCRQWHAWSVPLLYESIFLGKGSSLPALRDALMKMFQRADNSGEVCSPGWWTKRLDIALRDMGRTETEVECIADIIRCLPNLSIVNFAITAQQFQRHSGRKDLILYILQSFTRATLSSLRAVTWDGRVVRPDPDDWHAFLEGAINIRVLRCPHLGMTQNMSSLPFTSLESLSINDDCSTGELPSLRHLVTDVFLRFSPQPLFERHGAKLELVQLHFFGRQPTIAHVLAMLSRFCPKLLRVDITVGTWDLFGRQVDEPILLPPTVRVLGLQNISTQLPSREYKNLFLGLEHVQYGTALHYIQFIDRGNVKDLRQKHPRVLTRGLEILAHKSLELRDHDGVVIR